MRSIYPCDGHAANTATLALLPQPFAHRPPVSDDSESRYQDAYV
jgi:hypothetical protein